MTAFDGANQATTAWVVVSVSEPGAVPNAMDDRSSFRAVAHALAVRRLFMLGILKSSKARALQSHVRQESIDK